MVPIAVNLFFIVSIAVITLIIIAVRVKRSTGFSTYMIPCKAFAVNAIYIITVTIKTMAIEPSNIEPSIVISLMIKSSCIIACSIETVLVKTCSIKSGTIIVGAGFFMYSFSVKTLPVKAIVVKSIYIIAIKSKTICISLLPSGNLIRLLCYFAIAFTVNPYNGHKLGVFLFLTGSPIFVATFSIVSATIITLCIKAVTVITVLI